MKLYRISIELQKQRGPDDKYDSWDQIYQQIIDDLPVAELVNLVNRSYPVKMEDVLRNMKQSE